MGSEDENLDSFLEAIDDDPDWSSDEETGPGKFSEPTSSAQSISTGKKLTFEDVFGSPIKKVAPASSKNNVKNAPETFDGEFFEKLKSVEPAPMKASNSQAPHRLSNGSASTSDTVIDHYSRISLFRNSIQLYVDSSQSVELVLKDRNLGIPYVNLLAFNHWYRSNGKDNKKFWTSGVLTKKLSAVKTSANGNEYTIWELNDLKDLKTSWTVFLFGATAGAPSLSAIPVGAFIDLVSPSVMDSSSGPLKFSISKLEQIRHIATARYFGYCQGKRKDGKNCTNIVNSQECGVCIHHASGELRKLNKKAKNPKVPQPAKADNFGPFPEERTPGVKTVNFGAPPAKGKKLMPRMELQGGSQNMHRNSIRAGNHPSISFEQPKNDALPKIKKPDSNRPPLKIDPKKTKHLTEKDREILEALGAKNTDSYLPEMLVHNPNAGSRNYLQYLAKKQYELDLSRKKAAEKEEMTGFGEAIGMNREVLENMKKALNYVRAKGPIAKADPNALTSKKRKLLDEPSTSTGSSKVASVAKRPKPNIEVEFDFESDEFKKILNAKSKHESLLEEVQQDEYFERMVKKEAIENKLLTTFTIDTKAVMCRECKYVALGQSEYCKENKHKIKIVQATKRFFKCKDCGNRTMSLDRLPKQPCKNCNSNSWLTAPVGREKKGPVLASEVLAIRGDEEKFLGSSSGKMFLNI